MNPWGNPGELPGGKVMIKINGISGSQNGKPVPSSVNWHVTKSCNYNCVYCFAKFKDINKGLPFKEALKVPRILGRAGCQKLNFAGGEPLMYHRLTDLLKESHNARLVTTIQTNGSLLDRGWIEKNTPFLDGIGISLDTADETIQNILGRGNGNHVERTLKNAELLKKYGVPIKINTVVTSYNLDDDLRPLIKEIDPYRWKVFQTLPIAGENDSTFSYLRITPKEFSRYRRRNKMTLSNGTYPVFETNEIMIDSYWMIAPDGRFYDNTTGRIRYWETDFSRIDRCLSNIPFNVSKFIERDGQYEIRKSPNSFL